MSRFIPLFVFVVLLLLQTGCASPMRMPSPHKPALIRDYPLKTYHNQPRNDGYVIITPVVRGW